MKPYLSIILILSFVVNTGQSSKDTEIWSPIPKKVNSISDSSPPSDAIILFDGTDLSSWQARWGEKDSEWQINDDGSMTVVFDGTGGIQTKENFGSVQLHIEWKTSEDLSHKNQDRSNSGVFLQGRYEIQILDSYDNPTYVNGQAGSVYKQYIPLVNSSRKPGQWQSYDIIFDAPEFDKEGNKIKSGFFTVFHNGVLIHNKVEILGTTENVGPPKNIAHGDGPLYLQNHCCTQISFRNIWLRKL
ncbi:MAG: DUF1080 domain-containing protein [Bacteroidota bacterium]|nr:DUF1080 domain-containing protein [Bacteroidota bacterium]MEC7876606.1 DUF1080 domain-containing protein [Bacteroidota bacterium]MEC8602365.1 DUF1080 domain-containing protein [Bacteroidota bacterium]